MTTRFRPAAIDWYVGTIVLAGAVVIGWSALGLPSTPHAREWGVLAGIALVASRFPLRVPGRSAWFSISDTFFMTSALLFGPGPATVTIALDSMLMTHAFKTFSLRRFLFNSGAPALAFWTGRRGVFWAVRLRAVVWQPRADRQLDRPGRLLCAHLLHAELGADGHRYRARKEARTDRGVAIAFRRRLAELFRVGIGRLPAHSAVAVPQRAGPGGDRAADCHHPSRDAIVVGTYRGRGAARRHCRSASTSRRSARCRPPSKPRMA